MSGKQIAGIVCFIIASLLLISGISLLFRGNGDAVGNGPGYAAGRAVGAFLPSLLMSILALWLLKKPKPAKPARRKRDDDDDRPRGKRRS